MVSTRSVERGRAISRAQLFRTAGVWIRASPVMTSETENQITRNETPYTPVNSAIWMSGIIRYCDTPRKSQGKPLRKRPTNISIATQKTAHSEAQRLRADHFD